MIRGRLGDGRGLVDRGNVRLAQSLDITRALIVDRFNLQGVNYQTQGGHLWLRLIENFRGELLSFSDQILDGHRADDGAEMTGENSPGQTGHLVLVGEEARRRVRDRLVIIANLERDHRLHGQRYPLLGHARFEDLRLLHGQR